jgi:hypothetical protein
VTGAAVVVGTAVVVTGAAVVPVDEEQPAADTAQARRTGTNAGVRRTARPFRNRLRHESPPAGLTAAVGYLRSTIRRPDVLPGPAATGL